MSDSFSQRVGVLAGVALLASSSVGRAEVNTIDATVTAEVREFHSGSPFNLDTAFDDLGQTSTTLPLRVDAQLLQEEGSDIFAGAFAVTTFTDPRLSVGADPDEFGIDTAVFSITSGLDHTGLSRATEQRAVTFTAAEIGAADGTAVEAQSFFFVDGIIVLWGDEGQSDLSNTTAQMALSVSQARTGENAGQQTVLQASLTYTGTSGGQAIVTASGALVPQNVVSVDLSNFVAGLGALNVVFIPNIAIPYTYQANVGETFTLDARIEGTVENDPFTGAGILLGVDIAQLGQFISDVTGVNVSGALTPLLLLQKSTAPPPEKPLVTESGDTVVRILDARLFPGFPCAPLGIETALLAMAMMSAVALQSVRSRRAGRRPPTPPCC